MDGSLFGGSSRASSSPETAEAVQRLLQQTSDKLAASRPRPALEAFQFFKASLVREYGIAENADNANTITGVAAQAWAALKSEEKAPFEAHAQQDTQRYAEEQRIFEEMQVQYTRLELLAKSQGVTLPGEKAARTARQQPSQAQHQQQQQQREQQQQHHQQQQQHQQQQHAQQQQQLQAQHIQQQLQAAQCAEQQALATVQQLQRQLSQLQPLVVQHLSQAEAAAGQLPAQLQQAYMERQRQALSQQYQQQQSYLQAQVQQAMAAAATARQSVAQHEWQLAAQQQQQEQQQQAALQQYHQRKQVWQQQQQQEQQQQRAVGCDPQQHQQQRQATKAPPPQRHKAAAAAAAEAADEGNLLAGIPTDVPETIEVSCQNVSGTMYVLAQQVVCHCPKCERLPPAKRIMSCPQFESHTGAHNAKKWKTSLKVAPGGAPGVPLSSNGMQVGRWLELHGVNFSRPVQTLDRLGSEVRPREIAVKPPAEKMYASERLQKMQERRQQQQQDEAGADEEEDEQRVGRGRRPGAAVEYQADRQEGGSQPRPLRSPAWGGPTAHQPGRRLPGRAPKGGVYRPERVTAAPGHARGPSAEVGGGAGSGAGAATKPWMAVVEGAYQPIPVRYSGERCCVCDTEQDFDFDQLVACDLCGITVHQSCYGIMELPGPDEMWLCRACEMQEEGKPQPQCCVCPVTGGALKPTTIRGLWCHSACLQWIPELSVSDVLAQEPVEGVRSIPKERWDLLCSVCRQRTGAKIQCDACFTAYHPLCARVAGFHMEIRDGPEGPDGPVEYISYCARHARPQPQLSGARLVSETEEQGDLPDERPQADLDNAQPYVLPTKAPLPVCPVGAARAMPIKVWQRQQHGTGTGASSAAAYWIPGPLRVVEVPRKRQRAAGRLATPLQAASLVPAQFECVPGGGDGEEGEQAMAASLLAGGTEGGAGLRTAAGGGGAAKLGFGAPGSRWGGRGGKGRNSRSGRGRGRSGGNRSGIDDSEPAPEYVELLPLPEGVPEEVEVVCNGHTAILLLRLQRVVYEGQEMAASRFEMLAGKADAKKWKTSLYAVGSDGQPAQVMQDWLTDRQLDRKTLEGLVRNAVQRRAWERHQERQVEGVLEGLMEAVEAAESGRAASTAAQSAACAQDTPAVSTAEQEYHASSIKEEGDTWQADGDSSGGGGKGAGGDEQQSSGGGAAQRWHPPNGKLRQVEIAGKAAGSAGAQGELSLLPLKVKEEQLESPVGKGHFNGMEAAAGAPANGLRLLGGASSSHSAFDTPAASAPASSQQQEEGGGEEAEGEEGGEAAEYGRSVSPEALELKPGGAEEVEQREERQGPPTAQEQQQPGAQQHSQRQQLLSPPAAAAAAAEASVPGTAEGQQPSTLRLKRSFDEALGGGNSGEREAAGSQLQPPAVPHGIKLRRLGSSQSVECGPATENGRSGSGRTCADGSQGAEGSEQQEDQGIRGALEQQPPQQEEEEEEKHGEQENAHEEAPHCASQAAAPSGAPDGAAAAAQSEEQQQEQASGSQAATAAAATTARISQGTAGGTSSHPGSGSREASLDAVEADGAGDHPLVVDVVCGSVQARFDARSMMVTLLSGRRVSPREYERLSGRSATKKWKWSIKVDTGGGVPGVALEEWLCQRGLEGAAAPRPSRATLDTIRRQQQARNGTASGTARGGSPSVVGDGPAPRRTLHAPDCQCVICKQSRRNGRVWWGMQQEGQDNDVSRGGDCGGHGDDEGGGGTEGDAERAAGDAAGPPNSEGGEQGSAALRARLIKQEPEQATAPYNLRGQAATAPGFGAVGAPRFRDGKRAFLQALPQLATAGAMPHRLSEVPLSRCWTPEDWAAHRLRQATRAAAKAAGGQQRLLRAADLPPVVVGSVNPWVDSLEPKVSLGPGVHEGRPVSLKEKLEVCAATERSRITFGKSGIHGWGLFARVPIRQDSMVTEYRGVVVRASVAEAREARYRQQGRDCYLFNLDDQHVLDATLAGAISRFTNHSCSPSMYSKILNIGGTQRLVFFARQDIAVGQELTYNYRFEREEGEERLPCACGAPNCTGFLN